MSKSSGIAFCGALFAMVGIRAAVQHDIVPAVAVFILAVACGIRARDEWDREHA